MNIEYNIDDILNGNFTFKNLNLNQDSYIIKKKIIFGGNETILKNLNKNEIIISNHIETMDNVLYWGYKEHKIEYVNIFTNKIESIVPEFNFIINKDKKIKSECNDFTNIENILVSVSHIDDEFIILSDDMYITLDDEEQEYYNSSFYNFSVKILQNKACNEYAIKNGMTFVLWNYENGFMSPNLDYNIFN